MKKLPIFALILVGLLFGVGIAILQQQFTVTIPTTGNLKTTSIQATWTINDTTASHINWGLIDNATAYALPETLNLTNTNNTACILSLATLNLSPNIQALQLTWNISDTYILEPSMFVVAQLTVIVTASNFEPFSFDAVITATEAT